MADLAQTNFGHAMSARVARIALLGAESTGKTALAEGIAAHFKAQAIAVALVPEVLREWCDAAGRTPRPEEQMGIALEQARRTASAPAAALLVADTTPLMVAVYSDLLFADTSLYPMALAHQRSYDLTLLTGLDLPWVADGVQRDGPHVREPVDHRVRAARDRAGIPYHIVYGTGPRRLENALYAINSIATSARTAGAEGIFRSKNVSTRPWACGKCSDPECEHRLFSALLQQGPDTD